MLVLSRKNNEQIRIGNDIVLTVVDIRGDKVRIGIEAAEGGRGSSVPRYSGQSNGNTVEAESGPNTAKFGRLQFVPNRVPFNKSTETPKKQEPNDENENRKD